MTLKFGTDGVRGVANTELTPDYVLALARAAAPVLGSRRVLIGRDTRRSGALLEAALAAGFASAGVDVELLGVVPTPAVAYLGQLEGVAAAVITASHNPFADNGVKLFAPGGVKLPDEVEARIEAGISSLVDPSAAGAEVGSITSVPRAVDRYVEHRSTVTDSLAGIHVVIDCAHGAMSVVAPEVMRRLGLEVDVIGAEPDGCNINAGVGATHPGPLAGEVVARGAALGLAFDGDGDRLIAVDHTGAIVDGDRLIALLAQDMRAHGRLADEAVVVTVMSNLGFHKAMDAAGIRVVTTAVGDRYVLEALGNRGLSLGGEQSGHIVLPGLATTGDGLLAGLLLIDLVRRSGRSLAELSSEVMESYPQVLVNVRLGRPWREVADAVQPEIDAVVAELGGEGRVLVRPSGTEPVVRVMVEAATDIAARSLAERIARSAETAAAS